MKKIYLRPITLTTKVSMHRMICASNPVVGISSKAEDAVDAADLDSRRSASVWDDDDE